MKVGFEWNALNRRRIWMTVVGVMITGFSVGMFNFASFGMDPFQVLAHGIWEHTPMGFGSFYTIVNLLMLVAIYFLDRTKIGLGTIINIFLLGYMVEFSSWLWLYLIPESSLWLRYLFLALGIIVLCFGSALYYSANMGVSTYDAIALVMAERNVAKFQYCRIGTDLFCTIVGFLLGAIVGVGTVVTAFFMGPIIALFRQKISDPMLHELRVREAENRLSHEG